MKKLATVFLCVIGFTMTMALFQQKVEAAPVVTVTNHKHSYYGPYRVKISGLTMYPGFVTYAYTCGEGKPCSSYWGYDLAGL